LQAAVRTFTTSSAGWACAERVRRFVSFRTLTFPLGTRSPDIVESACENVGALSVTFADAHDEPVLEPAPGELRLWRVTEVQALFAADVAVAAAKELLVGALHLSPEDIVERVLEDRIWEREWLRDFHAQRFGRRLWVCPRHESVTDAGAAVVQLDPGLAFGTGHHPSTALCLEWLDAAVYGSESVIDYGCGSGILAIAALTLGCARAACFDIDPQALLATAQNAAANGLAQRLSVHADADQLPEADLVLANILSQPLISLAPRLAGLTTPHGRLVLAGLMTAEREDVTAAYLPWFDMELSATRDGWIRLVGTRRD